MHRRTAIVGAAAATASLLAGCTDDDPDPEPQIAFLELATHRHDETHAFDVRVEDDGETVFEATEELTGGDPGESAVVIEEPVSGPGAYEVTVTVDGDEATAEATSLVSAGDDCLSLDFYLGASTLHVEHLAWPCEPDDE